MLVAVSCRRDQIGGRQRHTSMTANELHQLRTLEGRRVGVAIRGGQRLDDCQLVSAGRGPVATLWIFVDGTDTFVPVDDVLDLWEAA
jgi:hypothetical protein